MTALSSFREDAEVYEALFELVPASSAVRLVLFKEWPSSGARCVENIVELPDSPRVGGKLMDWTSWIDDKDFRFAPNQIKLAAEGLKVARTRTSKANRIVCALKAQRPAA